MEKIKASRKNTKLRLAMCGESNSGKTWSALCLASTINGGMKGVTLLDTENRGHLYEEHFPGYSVIKIEQPFNPEQMIEALKMCEKDKDEIVILDSGSDFWDRLLQVHKEVSQTAKSSYYAWGKVGPRWDAFRSAINSTPMHVISCWRMKDKLIQKDGEIVSDGQRVVARGGSKGIKFDYHVAFIIDENHKSKIGKDNLNLFSDWKEPRIIDKTVGLKFKKWLQDGNSGDSNVGNKLSNFSGPTGP